MITPIRGRKLQGLPQRKLFHFPLKDDNPDKGTETRVGSEDSRASTMLKDDNPEKGTETEVAELLPGVRIS